MESKDLPPGDTPVLRTRSKRASLQLDASKFQLAPDVEESLASAQGPPTPSTGASSSAPFTPTGSAGRPRSMTQVSPTHAGSSLVRPTTHVRNRSATVANPPKSTPPGSAPPEKEKRKRSRVTPEQLTHLERIFALDRSPTAAKRKEISEVLGMQERQTQIWFQNRRAKAKTLEGKGKMGFRGSPTSGADSPPDTPPDFSVGLDVDLQTLIHEDEPVTIIPCSDLSIGSWRRISATLGQHDLVAYICNAKRCITWFIYSNGYGFKMEIPFDIITSTNFTSASPGQGLASFFLSRPPLFYLEAMSSPTSGLGSVKTWKKCADWTEGQQASKILRHDLVGAAIPLATALKGLPGSEHLSALPASAPLPPVQYHPADAMSPMHIPQPPMAGLEPPAAFPLSGGPHAHLIHGRKRSFSGPPALSHPPQDLPDFGMLGGSQAGPPDAQPSSFSSTFPSRSGSLSFSPDYSASLFRSFPSALPTAGSHQAHPSLTDFSTVPISHAAAPRPYSASSVNTRFPFDSQAPPTIMHGAADRFPPGETHSNLFESSMSSSPPLLTTSFNPAGLQHDVQMSPPDSVAHEMESSHYGGPSEDSAQQHSSHDPPFEATLDMSSSQHDPQSHSQRPA